MSATPFVRFDGVWKKFRRGQTHDSLRDLVPATIQRVLGRAAPIKPDREFWALRDLSFEAQPGDVLGIIGSNGAGKSTTLKLLNRIMDPTFGEIQTVGKIGALIEVSAGFHQDLTGRQNVFLQGAIMGMRRAEVARKFDEIVEFAGVADFIDTPVKRYSNGMNARLGFSIAAHLEPEILIIDEVLAVGDQSFQQRAYGRIRQMAAAGAPVVLVSHQLERIAELCTKCLLLDTGRVRRAGTPGECIDEYLHGSGQQSTSEEAAAEIGIRFFECESLAGLSVFSGDELRIRVTGVSDRSESVPDWTPALRVLSTRTGALSHFVTGRYRGVGLPLNGEFQYEIRLIMNLPPGLYNLDPLIYDDERDVDVVRGPRLQVEVLERLKFWGDAQLSAEWAATHKSAQRGHHRVDRLVPPSFAY